MPDRRGGGGADRGQRPPHLRADPRRSRVRDGLRDGPGPLLSDGSDQSLGAGPLVRAPRRRGPRHRHRAADERWRVHHGSLRGGRERRGGRRARCVRRRRERVHPSGARSGAAAAQRAHDGGRLSRGAATRGSHAGLGSPRRGGHGSDGALRHQLRGGRRGPHAGARPRRERHRRGRARPRSSSRGPPRRDHEPHRAAQRLELRGRLGPRDHRWTGDATHGAIVLARRSGARSPSSA